MDKYSVYDGTSWVELLKSSDISAWAKESSKPSYNLDEIPDGSVRKLSDYYPVSNPNGYTSVTETTVANWGFTKNHGTVTSIRVQAGTGLASSQNTAQTGTLDTIISIDSGYKLPTATEWNAKANSSDLGSAATKDYITSVTSGSNDLVTSGAVFTAISELPTPMQFKGTLGINGTISVLPAASASNNGYTYKVISDIASLNAKVGDVFVSNGTSWVLIPAGDDVEDTWREIYVDGALFLGSGISTGRVNFVSGNNVTMRANGNDIIISSSSNADTLDGHDSSYFYPASNPNGYIASISKQDVTTALGLGSVRSSVSWGTVTEGNRYNILWAADHPDGGGFSIGEKNGQTSMQVDGEVYVGEGQYRLAHVGEAQPADGGNSDTVDGEHASAFAHIGSGNNLIVAGNEFNFISDNYGGNDGADVWINYTTPSRNDSAKITGYILGNGHGGQLGTVIHSGNIGSQSVNYAASAGNADTLDNHDSSYFATASSLDNYLPKSGGQPNKMTGILYAPLGIKLYDSTEAPVLFEGNEGYLQYGTDVLATQDWVGNQGYTTNQGTVTGVAIAVGTGLSIDNPLPITSSGIRTISIDSGYKLPTTNEWNSKLDMRDIYGFGDYVFEAFIDNKYPSFIKLVDDGNGDPMFDFDTTNYSVVSGANDGTNWTSITINGVTKNIPSGGSSSLTLDDVSDGSTRKLNKVVKGTGTSEIGVNQVGTGRLATYYPFLKLSDSSALHSTTTYYRNSIEYGGKTLYFPTISGSSDTFATTSDIKHIYRHYVFLEIDSMHILSFSLENSSPTPITDFSKLSNALAYSNSNGGGAMGGGYYDDDYGCVYAISAVDLILSTNPAKLSFEYYLGNNVSTLQTITPSDITDYTDNVVEV